MKLAPHLLLCERCGYPLDEILGTPGARQCPECGLDVAESMPERRAGTPWQQKASVGSMVRTWWVAIAHPIAVWRDVRVDSERTDRLPLWTCAAAAVAIVTPYWIALAAAGNAPSDRELGPRGIFMFYSVVAGLGIWIALLALSAIESGGIQFFGARRGWRVTPEVASTVVGHASVGWLVGPALFVVVVLVRCVVWLSSRLGGRWAPHPLTFDTVLLWTMLTGAAASLLAFETLVYIGVRRMRFANAPRAVASPDQPTKTSASAGA